MPITSTNFTSISYDQETVPGVTNATPDFTVLPTTGGSLQSNITTAVSEVIRSDRMIDDLVLVDSEISGSLEYELSYGPYKPMIISLLRSAGATTISYSGSASTDFAASTISATGIGAAATNIEVGHMFYIKGFAKNDGAYRVTAKTDDILTVTPAPGASAADDETSVAITYDADIHVNGSADMVTYTFLKYVTGPTTADAYFYYKGCSISSMSMNFETGAILSGSFDVYGRTEDATETKYTGQTENTQAAYSIMNSVNNVVSIDVAGASSSTKFSSMTLNINNNTTAAKCIGVLGATDLADFTFEVTADMETYFEDLVIYNKFVNSQSFTVSFALKDTDGNVITVFMPNCKFESLEVPIDGKDNFLMLPGSFRALRDATLGYVIQFGFYTAP